MGSGVGDYYFSGGFGFIDSPPPWPARSSAAAGDFEVSYTPAPLLAESSKAYFVFDYSPHDGGLLRVMEKRLAEGHGSGFAEGHAPELLQVGDNGEGSAILYARASSCSISGSSSSSTASGRSSGDDNGGGKGRISEEQVRLPEGRVVQRVSKPHEEGGGPLCCKQVEYSSLISSNIVLLQDQQHEEEGPGSFPNTVCLVNASNPPPASACCPPPPPPPPPPPIFYSSAWVDLDSPDSFVNLQDIDDTWLDSLPPLNTTTSCSTSPSTLLHPAALMLPTNWGKLDSSSNVLPPPPPPSFEAANKCADSNLPPAPPKKPALIIPQPVVGAALPAKQLQAAEASPSRPARQEPSTTAPDRKRPKRLDLSEPKYVVLTRNYESVLKDGFKWRKYGQKSVKNNIYPRSYYKCSYEGCYVHKHVERVALDPCLILTTYRGRHTH